MAWNELAERVTIKAIGQVESGLKYDSINYRDPITVGIAQWFGTRAASLLNRMKGVDTVGYNSLAASIKADLDSKSETSPFWNSRYLTKAEGETIRPFLAANATVQNAQFVSDINESYLPMARSLGMDPDSNTDAVIFFFVMYHQSPKRARQVVGGAGAGASLDRLLSFALNEPVLGKYKTRYNTAATIIRNKDTSGVAAGALAADPGEPGGDSEPDIASGEQPTAHNIAYATKYNDRIVLYRANGETPLTLLPDGMGNFVPEKDGSRPGTPPVNDGSGTSAPGIPPSGEGGDTKRATVVKWMTDRIGRLNYSQQEPGRSRPDSSGFTDCSGAVREAYRQIGMELGSYTGAQYTQGARVKAGSGGINTSDLKPGDLIYFNWHGYRANVDHVEMYESGNTCIGHGGPGKGPKRADVVAMTGRAQNWYVQRHI